MYTKMYSIPNVLIIMQGQLYIWSENEKLIEEWALMYRIDTGSI